MSAWRATGAVFARDIRLFWSGGGGAAAPLGFFIGATVLVPLAIGADRETLAKIGPPLLWVTATLAALMTLDRLFQADLEDGSLDQMLLSPAPLEFIVVAKGAAAWLAVGLPLTLAAAPLAIAMQAPLGSVPMIMAGLAIGMAAFFGVGLLGAALAAGVRRAGLLIAVLVLPFYAPPVIFGAAAALGAAHGEAAPAAFLMLSACALAAAALGPLGAAAAVRFQID
ncbi:MAG TPA: heme exporter protein CcmB [Caulobacterales bacterium]|nr:heme exporter protein CcmB [Caulobacterales bacterium]